MPTNSTAIQPTIRQSTATEAVAAYGPRVSLVLKADIRPGHEGMLDGKVARLEKRLAGE